MTWQEYQDAVAELYIQIDEFAVIEKNIRLADKVTGQLRQIDVLVTLSFGGHEIKVVIDAKKYTDSLDVKNIEEVIALSKAVGANKTIIVCPNGWTKPAGTKAEFESCDLRVLTIEEALELMCPDMWELCENCHNDCIVLDQGGAAELNNSIIWWLAGQCRECKNAKIHCQDCGIKFYIQSNY